MDYGDILTTAWKRLWQEKALFWFGLLPMLPVTLLSVGLGVYGATLSEIQLDVFLNTLNQPDPPAGLFVFIGVLVLISGLSSLLLPLGWTAIAKGTVDAENGKTGLTFGGLWHDSLPFFVRAFGVLLVIWFGYFVLFGGLMMLMVLFGVLTAGLGFLCMFPIMLLLFPFMLIFIAGLFLSVAAVPAEERDIGETLQNVFALLKRKFWALILLSFILYLIQMGVGLLAGFPMLVGQFGVPLLFTTNAVNDVIAIRIIFGLIAVSMLLSFLASAVSTTFNQVVWTITWLREEPVPQADASATAVE